MDDAVKTRGIEYLNIESCLLFAPIKISGYAPGCDVSRTAQSKIPSWQLFFQHIHLSLANHRF